MYLPNDAALLRDIVAALRHHDRIVAGSLTPGEEVAARALRKVYTLRAHEHAVRRGYYLTDTPSA